MKYINYYKPFTSASGRKFEIHYNKGLRYFHCDKCDERKNWGYKRLTSEKVIEETVDKKSGLLIRVTKETFAVLDKVKSKMPCQKRLTFYADSERCSGTIKYAGYYVYVKEVTNRTVANMGGFGIESGSKLLESRYVKQRDDIKVTVKQLVEKYSSL